MEFDLAMIGTLEPDDLGATNHLTNVSWIAIVKAWPICKLPVTFGGGAGTTNMPAGLMFPSGPYSGSKNPDLTHQEYQAASTAGGLYPFAIGLLISCKTDIHFLSEANTDDNPSNCDRRLTLFLSIRG